MVDIPGLAAMFFGGIAFGLLGTLAYWAYVAVRSWPMMRDRREVTWWEFVGLSIQALVGTTAYLKLLWALSLVGVVLAMIVYVARTS
jgi:hypothetical protein